MKLFVYVCVLSCVLSLNLIIPFYVAPQVTNKQCTEPSFVRLASLSNAKRITVVLNPNNGPVDDPQVIKQYNICIKYLAAAKIKVLGYVHTKTGAPNIDGFRPRADISADIDVWTKYAKRIRGIFVDEVSNIWLASYETSKESVISFYLDIVAEIKAKFKGGQVVLNSGGPLYPELLENQGCKVRGVLFENDYAHWNPATNCKSLLSNKKKGAFKKGPWCSYIPQTDGVEALINKIGKKGQAPIERCQVASLIHDAPNLPGVAEAAIKFGKRAFVSNFYITNKSDWNSLADDPLLAEQNALLTPKKAAGSSE